MSTSLATLRAPEPGARSVFDGSPWEALVPLLDRAPSLADIRAHRLELLYAALLRERGRPVPAGLAESVRVAQFATLSASAVLGRVRTLCAGPLLVVKGPEVAKYYPAPGLRPFGDIDLLVPDAHEIQATLLAAGFMPVGEQQDWDALHHLQRLASPDGLFAVEIHKRPKWLEGAVAPSIGDLLADAVPSATGVDGVLAPSPPLHAVLLAAHAWAERPLGCIGDLLDVEIVTGEDRNEAGRLAQELGVGRVWDATTAASAALFRERTPAWPLRTWARHLRAARGQTVIESHLERVLAPFAALAPVAALGDAARAFGRTVRPQPDEGWRAKLDRVRRAFRRAFVRRREHEQRLREEEGPRD